jgi:glycosyltransferase involved in cell wall biosynthesis
MVPSAATGALASVGSRLPPVSVVLAVYNGAAYLGESIASLVAQTHADFELIVVDDGSTDTTPELLAELAAADARIRVVRQPNGGHAAALNRGIAEARHEWVARMDHDDRSLPERLAKQLAFLAENPDVHVLGSYAVAIDAVGRPMSFLSVGPVNATMFNALRASNDIISVIHPSVMMRKSTVMELGGYRTPDSFADIDLWSRVADRHRVQVLPQALLEYRVHLSSMTNARFMEMQRGIRLVQARQSARRRGVVEPTYEQLVASERAQPIAQRLARARVDWSLLLSKRALMRWHEGRRAHAAVDVVGATLLDPLTFLRRLADRQRRAQQGALVSSPLE